MTSRSGVATPRCCRWSERRCRRSVGRSRTRRCRCAPTYRRAVITGPGADLDRLSHAAADLAAAGRIIDLTFEAAGDDTDLKVAVTL